MLSVFAEPLTLRTILDPEADAPVEDVSKLVGATAFSCLPSETAFFRSFIDSVPIGAAFRTQARSSERRKNIGNYCVRLLSLDTSLCPLA